MFYYCTCRLNTPNNQQIVFTGYREVKVCKNDICTDCGYYAVASKIQEPPIYSISSIDLEDKPIDINKKTPNPKKTFTVTRGGVVTEYKGAKQAASVLNVSISTIQQHALSDKDQHKYITVSK